MIAIVDSVSLADALLTAPAGSTLALAAGEYVAPPGGFRIGSNVRVQGANPCRNRIQGGTIIHPASPNDHAFVIDDGAINVVIEDLIVKGPTPTVVGEGDGFHSVQTSTVGCVELRRCLVWGVGRDAYHFEGMNASLNHHLFADCFGHWSGRHGLYISRAMGPRIEGGYFGSNNGCGVFIDGCGAAVIRGAGLEHNQRLGVWSDYAPQLYIRGGDTHVIAECGFERFISDDGEIDYQGGGLNAITLENACAVNIGSCYFVNPPPKQACRGLVLRNKSKSVVVGMNSWSLVPQKWDIDSTSTFSAATQYTKA